MKAGGYHVSVNVVYFDLRGRQEASERARQIRQAARIEGMNRIKLPRHGAPIEGCGQGHGNCPSQRMAGGADAAAVVLAQLLPQGRIGGRSARRHSRKTGAEGQPSIAPEILKIISAQHGATLSKNQVLLMWFVPEAAMLITSDVAIQGVSSWSSNSSSSGASSVDLVRKLRMQPLILRGDVSEERQRSRQQCWQNSLPSLAVQWRRLPCSQRRRDAGHRAICECRSNSEGELDGDLAAVL
mmetsp:Transcript_172714/g.553614  ORF Transcript_172714/g.553614 Transcript_172714/m.553614 type:complete len:241 (-) Transcript_172714:375-1097(-)